MRNAHILGTRVFLAGGLLLFATGLFFIGNRHQLFQRNFEVYAEFDRLNGLQKGAKVRVSGMEAGEVLEAQIPNRPDERFRLKLRVSQHLHVFVRADSVAQIKITGLAGNSFLDIEKGTARTREAASGSTIPSREPFDIADAIQQGSRLLSAAQAAIHDLQATADGALQSLDSAARTTDRTVIAMRPELRKLLTSARIASENAGELVAEVEQGRGTLGMLLKDPKLAASVEETVENSRQSALNLKDASSRMKDTITEFQRRELLGRAQAVLESSRQVSEQVNQAVAKFTKSPLGDGSAAASLGETLATAGTAMANITDDTEALKHNFFLRGFFQRRGYFNLNRMTPAQYRSSKFLKGHSSERIWLRSDRLFSSGVAGHEELTAEGQAQVDNAINTFTPYLPNSPIVVEGYATESSRGEQFIRAQQRATLVKSYLVNRFHLRSNMVGVMPLSGPLPAGIGNPIADGVSLVLIR